MLSWTDANFVAEQVIKLLKPHCTQISVAGSVRRGVRVCGDVEIVARPKIVLPGRRPGELFAAGERQSAIEDFLDAWICPRSWLQLDREQPANGPRYKRLRTNAAAVDLFLVMEPASWGSILAIRTGPADFSKLLVTKRAAGGACPDHLQQQQGALWGPQGRIETASEEHYFELLGLPAWPPAERNVDRLRVFLDRQAKGLPSCSY